MSMTTPSVTPKNSSKQSANQTSIQQSSVYQTTSALKFVKNWLKFEVLIISVPLRSTIWIDTCLGILILLSFRLIMILRSRLLVIMWEGLKCLGLLMQKKSRFTMFKVQIRLLSLKLKHLSLLSLKLALKVLLKLLVD